jgi:hypothetical protein
MSLLLLPWAESRQRKATLSSERATSLLLEMATAAGVGAETTQHMFWAAEGWFGVDDPVVAEQHPQPGPEGARLGQRQQAAVELELPSLEGAAKSRDEPRFRGSRATSSKVSALV